jgi:hypothetical protein
MMNEKKKKPWTGVYGWLYGRGESEWVDGLSTGRYIKYEFVARVCVRVCVRISALNGTFPCIQPTNHQPSIYAYSNIAAHYMYAADLSIQYGSLCTYNTWLADGYCMNVLRLIIHPLIGLWWILYNPMQIAAPSWSHVGLFYDCWWTPLLDNQNPHAKAFLYEANNTS